MNESTDTTNANNSSANQDRRLLCVELLPQLEVVHPSATAPSPSNKELIAAALSQYSEDLDGGGIVFNFPNLGVLYEAKHALRNPTTVGNIAWAFYIGDGTAQSLGIAATPPTIHTFLITFYSSETNELKTAPYNFFEV